MPPRFLLDTHILVRLSSNPGKLSREQLRVLRGVHRKNEQLAVSAVTLLEIAILADIGRIDLKMPVERYFSDLQADAELVLLPITFEIAAEAARLRALRDPMDRTIAATARLHNLTLVTSDERIIDSGLTPVLA